MVLSIIVPVYNSEKWLYMCIDSLVSQTYKNIEIILVDDGSIDRSADICDHYCKQDSRVKVIHKENGGVSSARNAGLVVCTGDYVTFLDSDDWLDINACKRIIDEIDGKSLLYIWNLRKCIDNKIIYQTKTIQTYSISESVAHIIASPKKQSSYIRAIGAKVFKRELLINITFPETLYIGEDACFLLNYLSMIDNNNNIKIINECWYNYRIIQGSAVRKHKPDLIKQSILQLEAIKNIVKKLRLENNKCVNTALTMFCWNTFISLKHNERKSGKGTDDCAYWYNTAKIVLINKNIDYRQMPKFILSCWYLSKFLNEKQMEGIAILYGKYKRKIN